MGVDRLDRALAAEPRRRAAPNSAAPCASVAVLDDLAAASAVWATLQQCAPASPYQTAAWLRCWLETEGAPLGVTPMIVVAYDDRQRATALLPFGIRKAGPVRVASFLGGRHSNYNMGLFAPGWVWSANDVEDLLRRAAAALPGRLDVYALVNQPQAWNGAANPLALLDRQPSPSSCHRAVLTPDPEAFLRVHQSAAARKKLRAKLKHLGAIGAVTHLTARTPAEVAAILDAHLAQKSARLAFLGASDVISPVLRTFLDRAAEPRPDGSALLELHGLLCGERIVATFGGLSHAGRFSGLLISYDAAPEIARNSPGELLLTEVIAAKCREGFSGFDLGIGEARYKESYCPIDDPLFDSFLPLTLGGRAFVLRESLRLMAKRSIKQSGWAWSAIQRFRRFRGGGYRPSAE
jgi:CelD/BcsL family acetyltransferase involved in cellulose biosynthesis